MEVQKAGAEREKVGEVAKVFDEHDPAAVPQTSPRLGKPSAPFLFAPQLMNRQQAEHDVGKFFCDWPLIV
jgi:hypothetical protein